MPAFHYVPRPRASTKTKQRKPLEDGSDKQARTPRRASAHRQAIWIVAILALGCLCLTACGGSSGSSSTAAATTNATTGSTGAGATTTSTAPSSQGSAPGNLRGRVAAVRECLQKNGVTLPRAGRGSNGAAGSFLGTGGTPALPKGMTRAQFQTVLTKCGGGNFARPGGQGFRRVNSPVFTAALTKYAACLRQNGINIAAPNTSGKGPIFSTKGVDTSSPKFRQATMKCRASLISAFRRPQGAGAPGAGAPPAGETSKSPGTAG